VQRVAVQREVERVAADLTGRLQPAGQRELVRLAGERSGEEPPLDLRRERERNGPLAPLEQVGVPAVRNDHVGELVGGELHVLEGDRLRLEGEKELEHADRLPAAGHRRDDARVVALRQDDRSLCSERLAIGRPVQRNAPRGLLAPRSGLVRRRGVAQAVQRAAAEVRDQEAHVAGAEHLEQRGAHRVDDADGRGRLRPRQQGPEVETARAIHVASLRFARARFSGR